jgi:hypothetical protein
MSPDANLLTLVGSLGAAIGVGKLLITGTPLKWQLVLGHALVTGGIALGGLSFLAVAKLDFVPLVGLTCAIAVGGTVALEKLLDRVFLRSPASSTPPSSETPPK